MDNNEFEETPGQKIKRFITDNVIIFLIVAVAAAWTLRGLLNISESGKTVQEILSDSVLGFLLSFALGYMLKFKGVQDGQRAPAYVKKVNLYEDLVDKTRDKMDYLDRFCEMKNIERYESQQRWLIKKANLSWEKFVKGEYSSWTKDKFLTKRAYRLYKEALNVKQTRLTTMLLLSTSRTYGMSNDEVKKMKDSVGGYLGRKSVGKVGFACISIVIAYFSVTSMNGIDWAQIIWRFIEVTSYIITGLIGYYTARLDMTTKFVANVYDSRIQFLTEFHNILAKNPAAFEEKIEDKKDVIYLPQSKGENYGKDSNQ